MYGYTSSSSRRYVDNAIVLLCVPNLPAKSLVVERNLGYVLRRMRRRSDNRAAEAIIGRSITKISLCSYT